jgi:hypothetical protein
LTISIAGQVAHRACVNDLIRRTAVKTNRTTLALVVVASLLFAAGALAAEPVSRSASTDWPQWRGPNRDGVAINSPKLLDAWPKDGPPLLWKSEYIPSCVEGGCGSPVMADGKVFLYVDWRDPIGDPINYHVITPAVLKDAGWLPDLPEALSQKIEAAWAFPNRPNAAGWPWQEIDGAQDAKAKELDEFLAKHPDLDKYIKAFVAALAPDEAAKYGDYVKRRFCMEGQQDRMKWGIAKAYTWDELVKLSKLQDRSFPTFHEWQRFLERQGLWRSFYDPCPRSHTRSDTVVCVEAATGKTLWKYKLECKPEDLRDDPMGHNAYGCEGTCSTPAFWQGRVYVKPWMREVLAHLPPASLVVG